MPDLAAFEVLTAVSRSGSLSGAAQAVGTTQQAVSARIAAMEAQTGVRLVTRSPRGSELTPSGALVVQWADRLLQVAHEVETGLSSLRESTRRRVRVSASLTIAEQLLPGWLVSLREAAEHRGEDPIEIVLTAANTDHVVEQVRAGDADLGFVEGPRVPGGLGSRVVAHDELLLVVRPDHPWSRRRRPIAVAELAATSLVTREPGSGTRDFLEAALRAELGDGHALARPAFEMSTAASVRATVLAGAAPAVLSGLAVADDVAAGRLRVVAIADLDLRRDLRAIWDGGRTPPAGAVRDVLTHIRAVTRA